jgi:hypothetical protein
VATHRRTERVKVPWLTRFRSWLNDYLRDTGGWRLPLMGSAGLIAGAFTLVSPNTGIPIVYSASVTVLSAAAIAVMVWAWRT